MASMEDVFGVIDDFLILEERDVLLAQRARGEPNKYDKICAIFDGLLGPDSRNKKLGKSQDFDLEDNGIIY